MNGEVIVMIIFAIGILVALALSLLALVLRQVKEGDITWWVPSGAARQSRDRSRDGSQDGSRPPAPDAGAGVNGARERSR